jgi:hemerythrin
MTLLIEWTSALEIGHPQIDEDHRHLIELLNRFDTLAPTDLSGALAVLVRLREVAIEHFRREEALMDLTAHDHRARHVKEHLHLADDLSDRIGSLQAGNAGPGETARNVRDWLLEHIAFTDRTLAEALAKAGALRRRSSAPSGPAS